MRILILNQFYLPDMAPTGQHAHDLARVLVQRGHQVKVICSCRSYDGASSYVRHEIMDGVEIARLPATGFGRRGFLGKIADYASFYVSLLVSLLAQKNRPDLIVSLTTPPYIGLLAKLAAKRYGCRHAHWIMDLYPDVMVAHGMARSRVLTGFLRKLTQFQFKGACQIMTLGPNMAECVARYVPGHTPGSPAGNGQCQVSWFPLWSKPELSPWPDGEPNSLRAERKWTADQAVFLYSGNMGLGHRFGEFLEAARRLGSAGPRWVFAGGGKRKAEVVDAAKSIPDARIDFLGYVPHNDLRAHLCAADVHLVSLDSAWQGFMVPSKLQGSFAVGRSVIYVGGRNCETAAWIQESGGGWVVDEDDVEGLLKAAQQALDPVERRKRGQAALKFAQQHFQTHANCTRMAEALELLRDE